MRPLLPSQVLTLSALIAIASTGFVQAATFVYHGTLQDAGKPAEGRYDVELTLYSAREGGNVVGGPLMMYAVPVHDGRFDTRADFGPLTKNADQAWLGVKLRAAGSEAYVALSERSAISVQATGGVCPGAWTIEGNAGNPPGSFLGTTDVNPLTIVVNNLQVGQISASTSGTDPDAPNVVFGSSQNAVSGGVYGATIGGGGDSIVLCGDGNSAACINTVGGDFGTVGGGYYNNASAFVATVAGGEANVASARDATVGGGLFNTANQISATVGGGTSNMADGILATVAGGGSNIASGFAAAILGGNQNTAGGDFSFAGGAYATVRDPNLAGNSGTCTANVNCGDYGAFVWSDGDGGIQFTSTGPEQFLVHASGGFGINTALPVAKTLTVAGGGGAIASAFAVDANSVAVFENNAKGFIETVVPAADETGILFSLVGSEADGGVEYNGTDNPKGMSFRTGGNVTKMRIDSSGDIYVNRTSLGNGVFQIGNATNNGNGAYLSAGGVWTSSSSRTFKDGFASIDAGQILAKVIDLPVQTWFYKNDHQEGRHLGPVAEDFSALFALGNDEEHIGTVDENGVALAAIQGLNAKVEKENGDLREQNAALQTTLDELRARLNKLEASRGN